MKIYPIRDPHLDDYLPLSGGIMEGDLHMGANTINFGGAAVSGVSYVGSTLTFYNDGGGFSFGSAITGSSLIKSGGTSAQFLKADGSVDSTAYLPLSGGTMLGNLLFTDASYDIGASGANRPRNLFLSGGATIGGALGVTGLSTLTGGLKTTTTFGYGSMYMYGNITACAIDVANVYHAVYNTFGNNDGVLAPLRDTTYFTYKAGAGYAIASVANYNSPTSTQIQCTVTAGHALIAGEPVTITGSTDYDGTYLVLGVGLTATEFVVTKAYTQTRTGSVRRPATLKALVAGNYRAGFNVSGVASNPNDNIKCELNKDATPLDNIIARALWPSATKYTSMGSHGLVSLTVNQYVWLSVKNYDGANNITISTANVYLERII